MDKNRIKAYAPVARKELIAAITAKAQVLGLSAERIEPVEVKGDVALIAGRPFPRSVAGQRRNLETAIKREGFGVVMERIAFTWFNRFSALRYMEIHGFLDHGYRVLSHPNGGAIPEILEHATDVDLIGLDKDKVTELRLAGHKDAELYRMLLVAQCNTLHSALPFLFEKTNDETELLLPDNLLHTDSPIRKLVSEIDEADWSEVEIIGWLYQFYISEKKDQVIGKVVKSEDIPAATQLFTPNWIVKYLVQNTLGRQWLATYPQSGLRSKMEYYIEPAEQTEEVKAQLKAITPTELNPETITFLDPACGSGHILVEAYNLFKEIYLERGYRTRDIPRLILEKNLYGLDIDERAAQLANFALMMKARADERGIFRSESPVRPNVLAIQESNGLDVDEIISVLTRDKVEKLVELDKPDQENLSGISDGKPVQHVLTVSHKPTIEKAAIASLLELFKDAKTFGSLLRIPESLKAAIPSLEKIVDPAMSRDLACHTAAEAVRPFVRQAKIVSCIYDHVVANPPYMGSKGMNERLLVFAKKNFPDAKSDLFAMFIEKGFQFAKPQMGHIGMVTMQSWMFLSSYEALRKDMLDNKQIETLIQIGYNSFPEINSKVAQACAFTIRNSQSEGEKGVFVNLNSAPQSTDKEEIFLRRDRTIEYFQEMNDFKKIPGSPIAYWMSEKAISVFSNSHSLDVIGEPRQGCATSDNNRFLRIWQEISLQNISFNSDNIASAMQSKKKWFPYNKGGQFRRWFGNQTYVVNWKNDGDEIKKEVARKYPYLNGNVDYVVKNRNCYFRNSLSWSKITSGGFSLRYYPNGFIFDVSGCSIFFDDNRYQIPILGCMNSHIMTKVLNALSPTLNYEVGQVAKFPVIDNFIEKTITSIPVISKLIELSKADWNSYEYSWNFVKLPLLQPEFHHSKISIAYKNLRDNLNHTIQTAKRLEEENNQIFIEAYNLQDELNCDVSLNEITLECNSYYRYGENSNEVLEALQKSDTTKELLSYAVGCMMGRYSLDKSGLIYANAGNEGFDHSQYKTFPADDDGIIPVSDIDWFTDDATLRLIEFIRTVFGPEHLDENLAWIAESFDPKKGEAPVDTIRRYFSTKFFKDHMQMYKKRPIYWLFSSGKQRAFEALVYLHRYNETTLSRMRAQYVTPLQGKINARIEHLRREIDGAGSASLKTKLRKEVDTLTKKQTELANYDEELRHYADKRIKLDLDDGVRVNYGKFGGLLADTKAITGGEDE